MTRNKKIATILGVLAGVAFISSASIPIIFHAKKSNETRNSRKKDIQYLENLIKLKNEQEVNNNKFLLEKKLELEQLEIKRNNVKQVINLLIGENYDKNINQLHKNNLDNKSLVYYLLLNIYELTSEKDLLENNNKELLARLNEIKSSFDNEKNELVNQINNLKQENKELLKEKNNLLKQQKYLLWIYQSRISTLKDAIATINGEFKIKENNYKETIARLNEEKNRLISEADSLRNNLNIKRVELETANNKLKTSTSKLVELLSSVININSLFEVQNETFVSNEILDNLVITSETEINSVIESNSLDNYLTTSLFLSNQILDNLNKVISNNKKIESNSIETNNLYKSKLSELIGESEEYSIGDNGKEALENSIVYNLRKQINDISLLINDNKAKIKQLEIDVDSLTNQIESKTQNNQDLARQVSDISNSITEKNRIIESLNSEIQASKSLKSSNNENIEKYKSMLISLIGTDDKDFNFDNLAEAAQNGIVKQLHQKYNEKEQEKNELISRFETEKELLNNEKTRLQNEINDLERQIAEKEELIQTLTSQADELRRQGEEKAEELREVNNQIDVAKKEKNQLEQEKERKIQSLAELENNLNNKQNQISRLLEATKDLDKYIQDNNNLVEEIRILKNNISNAELQKTNLEHQYSEKQRDIDNINHDISRINNQIETLRSENQTILNDIQTLKTQKQELTDKKTRNEQEKQELERQIAEKEQEIQEKESEISNNQNEIQSLEANKSSRTNDISSKELELNNLFNSIRNLTDLNNELQSSLSQKEANKTQLEQEKSRLEETKINLESEVQSLTSDLNSLTTNISAKEQELENLNQNISNLNLEIETLNRNKSSLQEEIQRLVEQKNSQSGSNSQLEQEILEKQNQISQKQEEINEKNSEKSTFEQTKNDLLNEIQTLQIDLGRKQTNLQELTSIHTELNNKVNELTNDKSNKTQNHETLKNNLRDLLSHENDLISSISELSASINKYKELLRIITNNQDENQTITNEGRNVVDGLVKELWDKINALEAENSALDSEISTQTNKLNSLVGSENNNFDNATEDSIVGGMKNEVSDLEEKIEKIVIKAVDIEFEKKDTMFLLKRGKQTWNGFVFNNDHIGYTRFLSNRDNNVINSIYDNMRQNLRESGLQVSDEFKNAIISSSFIPNHLKSNGKLAIRSKIKIDISQQQKDELIRQGYPNLKITYRTPFDNTNKSFSINLTQRLGFTGMNLGEHSPNSNNVLVSSITSNENVWGDDNFLASQYNLGINKFTIYLVYMETSAGYEIAEFIDLYTTARAEHERSLRASYSFSTLIRAKRTNSSLTSVSVPSYIYNDGNNNIAEMTNRINKSLTNAGSANTFYTDISPMLGLDQPLTYQNFGRFDSSNPNYRKTFISDNLVVKNGISFANIAFSK